jgi:hypothetical protein
VALVMFLVESHPTIVLFGIGATHSFSTTTCVKTHNLSVETMLLPMEINSVGGKVHANTICSNIWVEIRGEEFPTNLIVMGMNDIDIILGMNWLYKYQTGISCDKRTVKLMYSSGEEIMAELSMIEVERGDCYQLTVDNKKTTPSRPSRLCLSFRIYFIESCQVCHLSGRLSSL